MRKPKKQNKRLSEMTPRELLDYLVPQSKLFPLYDYQLECIEAIRNLPAMAKALIVMATGLGKTITFTYLASQLGIGKVLILSRGKSIVLNAIKYFNRDEVGVEMDNFDAKRDFPDARVISASVDTIKNRLGNYRPDEFDMIIVDEAHHSVAPIYMKVIKYFTPKLLLGFTATPMRTDGVSLNAVYDSICFNRDIMWGIRSGHLCDVALRQVQIDVDLRRCRIKASDSGERDFMEADLAKAFANSAPAIVDIYNKYKYGPTLIFVSGVQLCKEVAKMIPGALPIVGDVDNTTRATILNEFAAGNIPCIVSVSTLVEGVDLPCTQTILFCRPTLSQLVYTQIVGRGLRLYKGKTHLNLVEIQGIIDPKITLCSVASLAGIDLESLPKKDRDTLNNHRLTEIQDMVRELQESPAYLSISAKSATRWADYSGYDLRDINWLMLPDGSFRLSFPGKNDGRHYLLRIPPMDALGRVRFGCVRMPLQNAIDLSRELLDAQYAAQAPLWDKKQSQRWSSDPISERQVTVIHNMMPELDTSKMTKDEASLVIANLNMKKEEKLRGGGSYTYIYPVDKDTPPKFYSDTSNELDLDGHRIVVYDYTPDPEKYLIDVKSKKLAADFLDYMMRCIKTVYVHSNGDLAQVVERVNASKKQNYAFVFLRSRYGIQYRYIQKTDGRIISRRDLCEWLAKVADAGIPRIINKLYIHPSPEPRKLVFTTGVVDMSEAPLNAYKASYPETYELLARKSARLPKNAEEIKTAMFEKWDKAREKELNKAKREAKTHNTQLKENLTCY